VVELVAQDGGPRRIGEPAGSVPDLVTESAEGILDLNDLL
jgi:hypothetical protein